MYYIYINIYYIYIIYIYYIYINIYIYIYIYIIYALVKRAQAHRRVGKNNCSRKALKDTDG